jgi:hypothetical protein
MRVQYLLIPCLFLLAGCGGHRFSVDDARKAIAAQPQDVLEKEDVDVLYVTQTGKGSAVAETRVKTAFLLRKENDQWIVKEVRIGNGQWEKIEDLAEALNRVKTEETRTYLGRIADSVRQYYKDTGKMPQFEDYIALSDTLAPKYLEPLIRLDSWRMPLRAETLKSNAIIVVSAGPDGRFSTDDDISTTIEP